MVDTAFVGHLNSSWLAALAICSILFGSLTWIFNFIVHTSTQAVSAAASRSDNILLQQQIKVSLGVAIVTGLFAFIIMFLFKKLLFSLAATPAEIYHLVDEYYMVRLFFHPFLIVFVALIALLRGLGRVKLSFGIILGTTFLNIFLTWLFLYPLKMSISGAAWGTSIANVLGSFVSVLFLFSDSRVRVGFIKSLPKKDQMLSFGKNSIHLFGRSLTLSSVFFLSTRFASSLGVETLAGYQISMQVWLFASFLTDGLAITANIYSAHFYGKGEREKIIACSNRLLGLSVIVGALLTLIYWFGREQIWYLFTSEYSLVALIASTWGWIAFSQLPNALTYTLDGILFGLEGFSFLRTHIMLGSFLLFFPLAMYGSYSQEISYLWVGIILLNIYRGVSSYYYFFQRIIK